MGSQRVRHDLVTELNWTELRLLCPWDFPGRNTRVCFHFLLQEIFLTQDQACISCADAGRCRRQEVEGKLKDINLSYLQLQFFAVLCDLSFKLLPHWRRQWQSTPVFLPEESHGWRSLVGYSPWGATSWTQLSNFTFTFHFHALEKEMATHSSILAWRIPGTEEPGGLPSMGSHRAGHDWSDLAAAAYQYNALTWKEFKGPHQVWNTRWQPLQKRLNKV